jgi:hypothetical protein
MAGDFTNKAGLFVEIPPVEIRLVGGEDLIGLGNDPNLLYTSLIRKGNPCVWVAAYPYLGAVIFNCRLRKILHRFPLK